MMDCFWIFCFCFISIQGLAGEPLLDNFLLVTDWTHNKIYQVSLKNGEVRAVDIATTGKPNAVIFNPATTRVIWADSKNKILHSVYLNGSDYKRVYHIGARNAFADRLAIDSTSGNLYYTSAKATDRGFIGVSVISPNEDHLDLVSEGYTPRDIVVDPDSGLMFWTDHGTVPSVKKANMDGTSISVIISNNIKWPNGIAIDYQAKKLYLSDGYLDTIQRCTYYGSCTTIYTDAGAHLMDIELSGHYLYYTAWKRTYITKMKKDNSSDISRLVINGEIGRLDSISIYSSSGISQPVNDDCLPNGGLGDCSTFCLPTASGRSCRCQDGGIFWPNSNVCNDIPKCTSTMKKGQITEPCTYLHMAYCSYSCDAFYVPATNNSKMTCLNGQWNVLLPCVFSNEKCPATIDRVVLGSSCSRNNGVICKYSCIFGYNPTFPNSTLTCDRGSWNNANPCQKIEPVCITKVESVTFNERCLFQNGENCTYTCRSGYSSTASVMICIGGTWNIETPCDETTMTSITTPTTKSTMSSQQPEALPKPAGHSAVPTAAGAGAGGIAFVFVIVVLLFIIYKRSARPQAQSEVEPQFEPPCYQGLGELATVEGLSSQTVNQSPNSTYEIIAFDKPSLKQCSPNVSQNRNENVYTSLSKRGGVILSGEYETLTRDIFETR